MESKATWKYARISPRKARLIADLVKKKTVKEAKFLLDSIPRKACLYWSKVIKSALANLNRRREEQGLPKADVSNTRIERVIVNQGPTWKRFMPRARGRAFPIRKRTSHLCVVLKEIE